MYNRIVVPLDGSNVAEEALGNARELATQLKVPVHLIRVVDTYRAQAIPATGMALDYSMLAELAEEELADAREYMTSSVNALAQDGLDVTGEVLQGPVAPQIVDAAKPGDVIVMSSHGRTGIKRWFLGSVAEEVVRRADVPVLLIRSRGATKAEQG
ncbi:MAG TPA: universal stress protein [Thermomicrobiales bacterium]|jgi:nucleotide-binding universal stress UspA family protein|nr:universal stress protein [Thermomicrobiales bacterium]